jgi:plasmid stabilization system protein ParE
MKTIKQITLLVILALFLQNCASTKVLDAWKAESSVVDLFKQKNVLVIARTENTQARLAFEIEIANALRAKGIKVTESYKKAPKIHTNIEMSEERVALIKSLLESEGFNAVVITVVKDKSETVRTSSNGVYMGASYNNYYPGHYGGFYNYYRAPYAYGSYYNSFGGYIPTSSSTYTETKYVLETVAYNLDEPEENQLVAVVTTSLDDPKQAYKTAAKYVELMMKNLEDSKK